MAANTRYHITPEDPRPSLDTIGDDERLLGPASETGEEAPALPNRKEIIYSYHPTLFFRLANIILLSISLAFYIISHQPSAIAADIFISIALLRNVTVILQHLVGRWIRFHIEIVGSSTHSLPSKPPAWLKRRRIQIAIDLLIFLSLIIATPIAFSTHIDHYDYYWGYRDPHQVKVASILCWVTIPFQVISAFDAGAPSSFPIRGAIIINCKGKNEHNITLPLSSGDVETATLPQKAYSDSPVYA